MKDFGFDDWHEAARDLSIQIEERCEIVLNNGRKINADLFVRSFGADKGMIVVRDYQRIAGHTDDIISSGFGYSVLTSPTLGEQYDRSDFISMLSDWGWTGPASERPQWLPAESEEG